MHQTYSEFSPILVPALVKAFSLPGKSEADTLRKKRVILRLLCELFLAGIYTDIHILHSILKELVSAYYVVKKRRKNGFKMNICQQFFQ